MKKLVPIIFVFVLLFSSCISSEVDNVNDVPDENLPAPSSYEELYSIYSQIDRGMNKSELDSLFGEPVPSYNDYGEIKFYTYFNSSKSAGASVIFDSENKISGKILFFNTKSSLIPFSDGYSSDKISLIKTDMSLDTVIEELGSSPLEISCTYTEDGPYNTKNIYVWYNNDGSSFMVHTDTGLVENVALYRD